MSKNQGNGPGDIRNMFAQDDAKVARRSNLPDTDDIFGVGEKIRAKGIECMFADVAEEEREEALIPDGKAPQKLLSTDGEEIPAPVRSSSGDGGELGDIEARFVPKNESVRGGADGVTSGDKRQSRAEKKAIKAEKKAEAKRAAEEAEAKRVAEEAEAKRAAEEAEAKRVAEEKKEAKRRKKEERRKERKTAITNKETAPDTAERTETSEDVTATDGADATDAVSEEDKPLAFVESLKKMKPSDIKSSVERKEEKRGALDRIRILFLIVCLCIFAISTYRLAENLIGKYKASNIYNDLAGIFEGGGDGIIALLPGENTAPVTPTADSVIESVPDDGGETTNVTKIARMKASLDSLKKINSDIYGWIVCEEAGINYPIVRGPDNDYYLNHAYTGDNIPNGAIFADYRCYDRITDNYNSVIYGHNMSGGGMFHGVENFRDEGIFKDSRIYIYTFDGIFVYRTFSFYETTADSGYIRMGFENPEEFGEFLDLVTGRSMHKAEVAPTTNRGIITLSTCTNGAEEGRYALHAMLVEYILG